MSNTNTNILKNQQLLPIIVNTSVKKDGEGRYCLNNICEVLNIANSQDLMSKQLDRKGGRKTYAPTVGGEQELAFINELNLYRVIFRSNKAEAKHFQDWVFNEVLPSIRKTGDYMATILDKTPEQTLSRALIFSKVEA
ncbi:BRO-N domain-containing protein [Commensalibacter oyaizuii]|uniref:BRO family protein n=1 Tax=Commensalibacter oyaizuii TaxID=3043873 RepID=A0ABT6Q3F9_9PROT|nr:BRO family protein [Commensalibacter sp. TBRC 16381]MDI2091629.1 BRO family protein [Commensalibacter sp. TBRC 16381]